VAQKKSKTTTVWTGRGEGISSSPCAARRRPVISHHHRHQATITNLLPTSDPVVVVARNRTDREERETPGQVGRCTTRRDHRSAARAGNRRACVCAPPVGRPGQLVNRRDGDAVPRGQVSKLVNRRRSQVATLPLPDHGTRRRGVPSHAPQTGEHKQIKA